jgi:hypothetical protein
MNVRGDSHDRLARRDEWGRRSADRHGFFMNWFGAQEGEGVEYHLLALGLALALIVNGAGAGRSTR